MENIYFLNCYYCVKTSQYFPRDENALPPGAAVLPYKLDIIKQNILSLSMENKNITEAFSTFCPEINNFISDLFVRFNSNVISGIKKTIINLLLYLFARNSDFYYESEPVQKMLFVQGTGSTGKSSLINLITRVVYPSEMQGGDFNQVNNQFETQF
jgi:hypothetical protein